MKNKKKEITEDLTLSEICQIQILIHNRRIYLHSLYSEVMTNSYGDNKIRPKVDEIFNQICMLDDLQTKLINMKKRKEI